MQHPPIAVQIWDKKYRFRDKFTGDIYDETLQDTWLRIARALAVNEGPKQQAVEQMFFNALEDFKYLPAGRITAGAGTSRQVTLFNCYVMGTVPDSIDGIYAMIREAALTMQQGGGIGYDFSTIRPKGAQVKGVAADASGPLSFMDCWDVMCKTIMSAGERRGAMMATMRCDHPDIEDFITAKRDSARLRMFNLSVLVTDPFMAAVKDDLFWDLKFGDRTYKSVRARDLWDKIIRTTYDVAEPGVIFIDRINKANNLHYCETISSTNPCGEQPLPPYGACLLGSINLARLVVDPFTDKARLDLNVLRELVKAAVRMMDNVVDVSVFPLEAQMNEAKAKRRIGLGVTGLADALAMMRLRYGSPEAVQQTEEWMRELALGAYMTSSALAEEKGSFPLFDADKLFASGTFASKLPKAVQDRIRKYGLRNSHLTSVAPTGTISLYAGNVSSGIEPIFATAYTRKVLNGDGTRTEEEVVDYAVALYRELFPGEELPDYFVTAQELAPADHIRMQAAAQKWVDSSISKTINCPEDISFEDFKDVYQMAWDNGCKGCTTYRPNAVTGSVLEVKKEEPAPAAPTNTIGDLEPRPRALEGATYKLKWPNEPHAFYVTFTDMEDAAGVRRPFEMFINSKNVDHFAWTVALTRMISAVFRRSQDSSFVAKELREVFDPKGGAFMQGRYVPSLLAALGDVVAEHMTSIGYGDFRPEEPQARHDDVVHKPVSMASCKACGSFNLSVEGGCATCKDCGSSKCG
jgi:ribonucleoside-diphosphate reductase alpha chain